eukprot:1156304-Pelagomonas_calceolata.AAC.4
MSSFQFQHAHGAHHSIRHTYCTIMDDDVNDDDDDDDAIRLCMYLKLDLRECARCCVCAWPFVGIELVLDQWKEASSMHGVLSVSPVINRRHELHMVMAPSELDALSMLRDQINFRRHQTHMLRCKSGLAIPPGRIGFAGLSLQVVVMKNAYFALTGFDLGAPVWSSGRAAWNHVC